MIRRSVFSETRCWNPEHPRSQGAEERHGTADGALQNVVLEHLNIRYVCLLFSVRLYWVLLGSTVEF